MYVLTVMHGFIPGFNASSHWYTLKTLDMSESIAFGQVFALGEIDQIVADFIDLLNKVYILILKTQLY